MEDVLALYAQPYDSRFPVVCFDESPYQLVGERHQPQAPQPGKLQRYDYQYQRKGTCNLFMFFEPGNGWRPVEVTERRTKRDFAQCMQMLVDGYYPEAEVICVAVDKISIRTRLPRCMTPFPLAKRTGCYNAWSFTTRPNTVVGSIWSRSNSPCWPASV